MEPYLVIVLGVDEPPGVVVGVDLQKQNVLGATKKRGSVKSGFVSVPFGTVLIILIVSEAIVTRGVPECEKNHPGASKSSCDKPKVNTGQTCDFP